MSITKTEPEQRNGASARDREDASYLRRLGERVRALREQRELTRKMLAEQSGVSERFLAQLESGAGNASVLVLRSVAEALGVELPELLQVELQLNPNIIAGQQQIMAMVRQMSPNDLASAYDLLRQHFRKRTASRAERIALVGMRGAGKSTLGKQLAERLGVPFLELDRLIEQASGLSLSAIFELYGQAGYRQFESRCLDEVLATHRQFVLATGGSLVTDAAIYERLRAECFTVWLRTTPELHMARTAAQGDMRPMANNARAMEDLQRILAGREPLYALADVTVDTSDSSVEGATERVLLARKSAGRI
jgi:XRE family transcriptional regulator, aerobic/anaerobic benzoate catabolism transcriptional regulator